MSIKEVTTYVTKDGAKFDSLSKAQAHEAALERSSAVEAFLCEKTDPSPYRRGVLKLILAWEQVREDFLSLEDHELKLHASQIDKKRAESRQAAKTPPPPPKDAAPASDPAH